MVLFGLKQKKEINAYFLLLLLLGSSGSMILNEDGKLISLLIEQNKEPGLQNQIAFGVCYDDLKKIIEAL